MCSEKSTVVCVDGLSSLLGLLGLLGQKYSLDVGEYTTLGNGHTRQKFVQLLVITDGQLKMSWDDPGLLVVTGSISSQLKDLSSQVFHDGGQVDWGTGSNSLGVVAFPQETVDTSHGELKSGPAAAGLALSLCLTSFATSRHDSGEMCTLQKQTEEWRKSGRVRLIYPKLGRFCSLSETISSRSRDGIEKVAANLQKRPNLGYK